MKHALESHRAFPIVAWTLILLFAALSYYLATTFKSEATALEEARAYNEAALLLDLEQPHVTLP